MKILWSDNALSAPTPSPVNRRPGRRRLMRVAAVGTGLALVLSAGSLALAPSGELDRLLAGASETLHGATASVSATVQPGELSSEAPTAAEADYGITETALPARPAAATAPTVEKAVRLATGLPGFQAPSDEAAPAAFDAARWGTAGSAIDPQASRQLADVFAQAPETPERTAESAFAPLLEDRQPPPPSSTYTGSIPPAAAVDPAEVPVAETEAEAAALEQRLFGEDDAVLGGGRLATANRHVNMRATADNDATILAVVPQNGTVELLDHCPNWCQVEYRGQRGYVFGTFLMRDGADRASLD